MNNRLHPVCIAGTGSFLPNDPVPNDRIDEVLGPLDDAPPRVRSFIKTVGRRMLEGTGIERRHFAVDPKTRELTHTSAELAEKAARRALDAAEIRPGDVEFVVLSCPTPDVMTPPTSTILQERLGIERCAEMEIHSNCSGMGKSVQVAFDALRLGRYKTALVVYPQLSSVYLRSCFYNQAKVTKSQAALRYILADGSGALVLESGDGVRSEDGVPPGGGDVNGPVPRELLGTYVESAGGKLPPAMTAGGAVADVMDFENSPLRIHERGTHHLDQDFAAVKREAGRRLLEGAKRMVDSLEVDPKTVAHIVVSIPSKQLYEDNVGLFMDHFDVDREQIKFRARHTGYTGGAAILIHFDEMVRAREVQPGDIVLLHAVESSKWMSGGFVVRW
jgi:3-oxoacyl-[acyl-carrier-protein] synthase-3